MGESFDDMTRLLNFYNGAIISYGKCMHSIGQKLVMHRTAVEKPNLRVGVDYLVHIVSNTHGLNPSSGGAKALQSLPC